MQSLPSQALAAEARAAPAVESTRQLALKGCCTVMHPLTQFVVLSTYRCKPRSCPESVQLHLPAAAAAADVLAVAKLPPRY